LLDTDLSPAEWRDKLKEAGDENDEYFVIRLQQAWAAFRMDKDATDWLKDLARTW
jgi:hypothetical protein